jgi:hypothetical protein
LYLIALCSDEQPPPLPPSIYIESSQLHRFLAAEGEMNLKVEENAKLNAMLSDAEEQEAGPLLKTIAKLARQAGRELAGTTVYSLFIGRRIQPLQHRSHPMWKYAGVKDSTRCSNKELSLKEVTDAARKLSKLSKEETFVVDPAIVPYSKENPLPKVRTHFFACFRYFRFQPALWYLSLDVNFWLT